MNIDMMTDAIYFFLSSFYRIGETFLKVVLTNNIQIINGCSNTDKMIIKGKMKILGRCC